MYTQEDIQRVADALLPGFIPKDTVQSELTFHFTLPPHNYKVSYQKDEKGNWKFLGFETADPGK